MLNLPFIAFIAAGIFASGALAAWPLAYRQGKKRNRAKVLQAQFDRRVMAIELQRVEAQRYFVCKALDVAKAKLARQENELAMIHAGAIAQSRLGRGEN